MSILGFNRTGLILTNAMLIVLVIYAFYYYTYRYKPVQLTTVPDTLKEFVSEIYYQERGKFWQILYRSPKNKRTLYGHLGYILPRIIIIASFLAAIHNLCQYYSLSFYDRWRELIGRPLIAIFILILISLGLLAVKVVEKGIQSSFDKNPNIIGLKQDLIHHCSGISLSTFGHL